MDYAVLKLVHQTAVVLSFCGFFVRGVGALRGAAWVRTRAVRTVPHIVDAILLASALGLAWVLQLDPLTTPWLAAKILGLLLYIGLGLLALRPGRSTPVRAGAWLAALATFAYIVSVALTRSPAGMFGGPSSL